MCLEAFLLDGRKDRRLALAPSSQLALLRPVPQTQEQVNLCERASPKYKGLPVIATLGRNHSFGQAMTYFSSSVVHFRI